jgi:hypothetical protein
MFEWLVRPKRPASAEEEKLVVEYYNPHSQNWVPAGIYPNLFINEVLQQCLDRHSHATKARAVGQRSRRVYDIIM